MVYKITVVILFFKITSIRQNGYTLGMFLMNLLSVFLMDVFYFIFIIGHIVYIF